MANSTQGHLHLIYGGSDFQLQSVAPGTHATPNGRRLDQHTRESTGVSESSKDPLFDMFFDYPLYEGRPHPYEAPPYEGETDATTQSDVFSERPESSPSAVTSGSSVGTGPDLDEDTEMTDAPVYTLPLPHNESLLPKVPNTYPHRHPEIHEDDLRSHSDATPTPATLPLRTSKTRRSSGASSSPTADPHKKTRRVPEPKKTSKVRENGACTLCKVSRVSCSADGVCDGCVKLCKECPGVDAAKVCIRRALHDSVGTVQNRWRPDAPSTLQPNSGSIPVLISFSDDPQSPCLQLQATRGQRGFGIVADSGSPNDGPIFHWARKQLGVSANRSFDSLLQQILALFVEGHVLDYANNPPSRSASVIVAQQKAWMKDLLTMRCMWNVWSWQKFHVRDIRGQPLPDSTQPIHEYLHAHAGAEISRLERSVLKGIDGLQGGIKLGDRPTKQLLSAYHLGVWISLWQLALVYRHSLGSPLALRKDQFRDKTEELYKKVVVLYSGIFRTSKALLYLIDPDIGVSGVFGTQSPVGDTFGKAWRAHQEFYTSFEQQHLDDDLIQKLVMEREAKVLSRKRPRK